MWTEVPDKAYCNHIKEHVGNPVWVNDGSPITNEIPLKKRELFGLIAMAHMYNKNGGSWVVGFDSTQPEPNDGFITDGQDTIRIENKVIVPQNPGEVLEEILATYRKYLGSVKGSDYGKDRTLIIMPSKPPSHGGLVRISDLKHEIENLAATVGGECIFDRVYTLNQMAGKGTVGNLHIVQHFPKDLSRDAQIDFDFATGKGQCPHCLIDLKAPP